ncbi:MULTISPECIES: SCO2102 family sporulation regulator [Streptomyces]|uniref:Uncharacterized protein n=2 Tax=Streptomyces TaxID=1883 RepID=A0ABT9LC39_STRGD|nr:MULTISPECIES: hypothetical protein [Streptomyces]MDP9681288.1 hypothetical protein [Streptomyces griseoviridis]GGS75761.1 hypothetical protein GCM10010240_06080 [Streptomyces griseoviridis]GGU36999.1 hypothetical protein GCM10010259_29340 [Streptomyces daghestanicus]GHI34712.1 hypothetical protein Sdagh_64420 [Streptomyces daghestanicus]
MGWAVLYIAFGVVALWLLGEVLLQYKARLRWRLLAFAGFLGVVAGVLVSSVVVIGLGAIAFAVGQTYVTLSFRRGFASGWAVQAPAGLPGSKRRRPERAREEPTSEVSDQEAAEPGLPGDRTPADDHTAVQDTTAYGYRGDDPDDVFAPGRPDGTPAEGTPVYQPLPMPDDTGTYGTYDSAGYGQDQQQTPAAQPADASYGYDYSGYAQQGYGYDATGQQQYAAYSDPYIGTHTYGGTGYETGYDASGQQQGYPQQGYGQDAYGTGGYGGETPPGGVWVPQQRSTDDPYGGELPPEQPYDGQQPQGGHGQGYDEQQYRY